MNIRQLLESRVRQHPDKAFLIFEDQVIYADFDTTVNRVANGFLRLGISAGDRVCVMLANCPEFLYAWFGLMKIGAILVPINSAFAIQKRSILCSMRRPQPLLDAATGPVVADSAAHLSWVCQRISLATTPAARRNRLVRCAGRAVDSRAHGRCRRQHCGQLYLYLGHDRPAERCDAATPELRDCRGIVCHACRPERRRSGTHRAAAVSRQCAVLLHDGYAGVWGDADSAATFRTSQFWEHVQHYDATHSTLSGRWPVCSTTSRPHRWRPPIACGSPVEPGPVEIAADFERRFRLTVLETYGLSECPMGTSNLANMRKIGSMGKPARHPAPHSTREYAWLTMESVMCQRGRWVNAPAKSSPDGGLLSGSGTDGGRHAWWLVSYR